MRSELDRLHLVVGYLAPFFVAARVEFALHFEHPRRCRDEVHHSLAVRRGLPRQLKVAMNENAELDLVPLARARRKVANGDLRVRQPDAVAFPQSRSVAVCCPRISSPSPDQRRMVSTANSEVSALTPTLTHPERREGRRPYGLTRPNSPLNVGERRPSRAVPSTDTRVPRFCSLRPVPSSWCPLRSPIRFHSLLGLRVDVLAPFRSTCIASSGPLKAYFRCQQASNRAITDTWPVRVSSSASTRRP